MSNRKLKYTTEEFIEASKRKFGERYNYDKTIYKGSSQPLTITCPKHGDFEVKPNKHLTRGDGCNYCNGSRLYYQDFVERAKKIHNGKYSYLKDIPKEEFNSSKQIPITCPTHGVFYQSATSHLSGKGCYLCSHTLFNTEKFIEKAKEIHGDRYDYSKTEYAKYHEKLTVTCKIHGDFQIKPSKHLIGQGCPLCSKNRKLTTEEFVRKATELFEGFYSYEKADYSNGTTHVTVTCPIHGDFQITPHAHLRGRGCRECGKKKISLHERLSEESIIKMANETHNFRYRYPNIRYMGMKEDIYVECSKHGEFKQNAYIHINGAGCPLCAKEKRLISVDNFIERAKEKYGDSYDYGEVPQYYTHTKSPVPIKCNKCGRTFWLEPTRHLSERGCPHCKESVLERNMAKFLQKLGIKFETQKTFGWLKNKGLLKLDFYLPELNTGIECQGRQHFEPVDFQGKGDEYAKQLFEVVQENDKFKKRLCDENGVKLIYFTNLEKYDFFLNEKMVKEEAVLAKMLLSWNGIPLL